MLRPSVGAEALTSFNCECTTLRTLARRRPQVIPARHAPALGRPSSPHRRAPHAPRPRHRPNRQPDRQRPARRRHRPLPPAVSRNRVVKPEQFKPPVRPRRPLEAIHRIRPGPQVIPAVVEHRIWHVRHGRRQHVGPAEIADHETHPAPARPNLHEPHRPRRPAPRVPNDKRVPNSMPPHPERHRRHARDQREHRHPVDQNANRPSHAGDSTSATVPRGTSLPRLCGRDELYSSYRNVFIICSRNS
jgi:hypothetical protein